jgi:hypothetical protein
VELVNFSINTLWFEIAVITGIFAFGQIFFAQFAVDTPKWRKVLKVVLFITLACVLSAVFGRIWFFMLLAILFLAFIVTHGWWLPKHGINGLTAEPKEKYYALRGWPLKD